LAETELPDDEVANRGQFVIRIVQHEQLGSHRTIFSLLVALGSHPQETALNGTFRQTTECRPSSGNVSEIVMFPQA